MSWGVNPNQKSDQWKNGWTDSNTSITKGGWGKGWGDSSSTNYKSDKKGSGWGKGWGNSSSVKESSSDKKGDDDVQANQSSESFKSNGWGEKSSSTWKGASFSNPFSKSENSQPSETLAQENKKHDLNSLFNIKPPPPPIKFNFGTGVEFSSTKDPNCSFTEATMNITSFMPKPPPKPQKMVYNENDDDDSKLFDLKEIDETTGEEGEEIIFNEKTIVYDLRKNDEGKYEYFEIGSGEFHFNYSKENDCYRMTMRRDKQNIVLNTRIYKEMKPKIRKRTVQFLTPVKDKDNADKLILQTFQFRTEDIAQKLYDLIVDAISKL